MPDIPGLHFLPGLALWAIGHVIVNGDGRSVILFGVLGLWAIAEILIINRREGAWNRPDPILLKDELQPALIGIGFFVVLLALHPYLFGVSPIQG